MELTGLESTSRKQRTTNWSSTEVDILIEEVKSNYSSLFGHFSATVSMAQKKKIWLAIITKINANSKTVKDVAQAKKKWADLKSITRKKAALQKKEQLKTGGGLPEDVIDLTDFENKIISIIPACQVQGIDGGMESEACELHKAELSPSPTETAQVSNTTAVKSTSTSTSTWTTAWTTTVLSPGPSLTSTSGLQDCEFLFKHSKGENSMQPEKSEKKKVRSGTHLQSSENVSQSILDIEREKLFVQRELLATEKERLEVEKERLGVETQILHYLRQQNSNNNNASRRLVEEYLQKILHQPF